jgi:hypothetical protein
MVNQVWIVGTLSLGSSENWQCSLAEPGVELMAPAARGNTSPAQHLVDERPSERLSICTRNPCRNHVVNTSRNVSHEQVAAVQETANPIRTLVARVEIL